MLAAALILTAALTSAHSPRDGECEAVERTAYLMGTLLRVSACVEDREAGMAAIEAGFAETARLESVLSSWRADTEIGRINAAPAGGRVAVSAELAGLLAEAGRWVTATGGAFDPAVGGLIDAWGFRGKEPRVPSSEALAAARRATGWRHARLDGEGITRGPAGWWLDTGGFGKGAALRALAAVLRSRGVESAVADFGGQLMVLGRESDVAVASPLDRSCAALSLRVREVSVSTSSQSERFIEVGGRRYGHVLDPRTGLPVPAWGSVTVVAADALVADALSTALFVLGPAAALEWAEAHPEVGVLVLEAERGSVRAAWSRALKQWLVEENVCAC